MLVDVPYPEKYLVEGLKVMLEGKVDDILSEAKRKSDEGFPSVNYELSWYSNMAFRMYNILMEMSRIYREYEILRAEYEKGQRYVRRNV